MAVHQGRTYPTPTQRAGTARPEFLQYLSTGGRMGYPPDTLRQSPRGSHSPCFLLYLNSGSGRLVEFLEVRSGTQHPSSLLGLGVGRGRLLSGDILRENEGVIYRLVTNESTGFSVLADTRMLITRQLTEYVDVLLVIRQEANDPPYTPSGSIPADPVLEFLGKGLKFPFTFQRRSGGAQVSTATSSDHAHIHESIRQILGTKKGERLMRPEFGTRLHELVFEQNDGLLYGLIRHEVIDALERWEPRIVITDVAINPDNDGHTVLVDIRYRLISSQVEGNVVWPFYRELE